MFKVTWATLCGVHALGVCECAWPHGHFRMYARVQVSAYACVPMHACVDAYTTVRMRTRCMRGCVHYYTVETFARGRVYGLVATHVRIAHGLNFMDDCVIWPNYTDNRMQPKAKAMQLKVKGMHLKMEACN